MNIYDLWFCSIKLTNKIKLNIIKKFKNTQEIWMNSIYENKNINICENNIQNIKLNREFRNAWNKDKLESIALKCYEKGINVVNFNDDLYPSKLKNYDNSPAVLFYIGNISELNEKLNVSIVGARKCSIYGKNAAEIISREVSSNGINIVSGMARGIDTCAHRGCIMTNGYTCAVLGSGIDVIYPAENKELYRQISKKGCVISEFMPGTPPLSYNFPIRNRIISGLCDVLLVVEAGKRSGALITADIALEQGKNVMAVPGSIFSYESKGTNKLIKEGAYPFTNLQDLFELLNIEYEIKNYKAKTVEKISELNNYQKKIYGIIGDTPVHIDDILRITNIDIKQLYGLLFELQLKKQIICLSGNYYVRTVNKNNILENKSS
ncbi:DNA processing protein [Clostridium algifaecis]|uniref:DNA processing protein n=1 Tax=Clostridium algifaecis TaxID=1472040 RepID=A0ABS4KNN4_9CLOT|nr:DNA-processing protein DprA [Clostridium algifaecis]MBP2031648.1 DNA processing protein [Clostridium algifaecis]